MNSKIGCLIIDDEPLARGLLRTFLLRDPDFEIIGECINPVASYELLLNNDVDAIFLDIQMPVISGIDFLRSLRHPPKIVFTTAYANYAAKAFDLNVVDYLVKPITEERFVQALTKLKKLILSDDHPITEAIPRPDYLFFKVNGKLIKVYLDDILYLEAYKDFTRLYLKNEKTMLISDHLKAVQGLLPPDGFIRVHRSFLVSAKAISGILGNTLEVGKIQIPIGSSYKEELFRLLHIK